MWQQVMYGVLEGLEGAECEVREAAALALRDLAVYHTALFLLAPPQKGGFPPQWVCAVVPPLLTACTDPSPMVCSAADEALEQLLGKTLHTSRSQQGVSSGDLTADNLGNPTETPNCRQDRTRWFHYF